MKKNFFSNLPIQRKITLLIMAITGVALILFTSLSVVNQVRQLGNSIIDNLKIVSGTVSRLSPESLAFPSQMRANELLGGLGEDKDIEIGLIYNLNEEVFGIYQNRINGATTLLPALIKHDGYRFVKRDSSLKLEVFHPILKSGKRIGTLYVLSNLNKFKKQIFSNLSVLVVSMVVILLVANFAARKMQLLITKPVYNLADTVRKISELGDYSVRVERMSTDEIGYLIDDFNTMLDAIEVRDSELHQHRHNLELLVEERTEELRNRRDEALAAAQAKTEFLANMSHEIRTPMNGVIGVMSLLKGASLTDEYRRLLETATRSADSLMFIINDILDFSKIDAGMIEFESIPFDIRPLVDETVYLFVDSVDSKKIDLMSFIPHDVHCYVEGDPTRLRQVLTNLVSNAVKFTSVGEVVLRVELLESRRKDQLLRFSVSDTGVGVPKGALRSLFEKFTQADGSTTRKYGGTGLGLSVCKQLVEMQGGDIGVESEVGEGTRFWFTLPFKKVPASNFASPCVKLDSKRILLVDDNETNRWILDHYLDVCNVSVTSCNSGKNALVSLEQASKQNRSINMVLIDYHMPGMDGLQLAEKIRDRFGTEAPEMFLLSSASIESGTAIKAGIKAVIYKPIIQTQLYDILSDRAESVDKQRNKKDDSASTPVLSGRVLLVDDEHINQKVAGAILEKFGLTIDLAANGSEAVALNEMNDYDIILMDIQMPEMSGFEATENIRQQEKRDDRPRVTIIAMTANAMKSTRARCLEVGMDDFISKPIKPEVLAKRLRPWLSGGEKAAGPENEESNTEIIPINPDLIWDRQRALQLAGEDADLLASLITMFLKRKEQLLQSVKEAVQSKDADQLDDAAHAYKGAVSHFAADQVVQVALKLEEKGKTGEMSGLNDLLEKLIMLSDTLTSCLKSEVE